MCHRGDTHPWHEVCPLCPFAFLFPFTSRQTHGTHFRNIVIIRKGRTGQGMRLQVKQEFGSPEPTYKLDKHGGLCNPRAQELASQSSLCGTSRLSKDPA